MVDDPRDLGRREVRIEQQAGLCGYRRLQAAPHECLARIGSAAVLPHDGVAENPAILAIPYHRGLALVGDADGRHANRGVGRSQFSEGVLADRDRGVPNFFGVVLHPAVMRVDLAELALRSGYRPAGPVENNRSGTGGPLVNGKNQ